MSTRFGTAAPTLPPTLTPVLLLFVGLSWWGIGWGLPSRSADPFLFPDGDVWSGERIHRLANAGGKFDPTRGADVDADPLEKGDGETTPLTANEGDVAKVLLRYRLYSYQPDEMITLMALSGMRPGELRLDPRLYQYGGLFIYPVGALIKLCGLVGLIEVRGDLVFYLDHPDEFGKLYIVVRAYSAAWGVLGVWVVYALTRRMVLGRSAPERADPMGEARWAHGAGLLAALLFTLLPVVVCLSHEGKPHLGGAVLMLTAVYFAVRGGSAVPREAGSQRNSGGNVEGCVPREARDFWRMCLCCGASLGMVLSSWPILMLIPLVACRNARAGGRGRGMLMALGCAVAVGVYVVTNPYVAVNAVANREVLRSNFGNSLDMYEVARFGEGLIRVVELTVEGATGPIVLLGLVGLAVGRVRGRRSLPPLLVVACVLFLQFVLIGAGKPGEYGRFGVFTDAALAVGAATFLASCFARRARWAGTLAGLILAGATAVPSLAYLRGFQLDAGAEGSRRNLARFCTRLARDESNGRILAPLVTFAEPAPYCFPPIDFAHADLRLAGASSFVGLNADPDRIAFSPVESAERVRPKHAEARAVSPILRSPWIVEDASDAPLPRDVDSTWRRTGGLGGSWLASVVGRETPISWANKPFFDSVFQGLATEQVVPTGR